MSDGDLKKLSTKELFESAGKKDELALEIVKEMGRLNAVGFANITNAYDPELITVGGTIALANPELILKPIKQFVNQYSLNRVPEVQITKLGEDAVLYGGLMLPKWFGKQP